MLLLKLNTLLFHCCAVLRCAAVYRACQSERDLAQVVY